MIYGLPKKGVLSEANKVFDANGRKGLLPDAISFNILIQSFLQENDRALELIEDEQEGFFT
ncbi:hypothetical protein L484_016365 [Morus notabilis]|uniref:Uncharacterized protein n=1 Tax=Morus notabilis TaxID=981085 RepID=W9QZL6_9ROSA|nr:hypothetical protein L484_016365 [Morus notabilis]